MTPLQKTLHQLAPVNNQFRDQENLQGFLDAHAGFVRANGWKPSYVKEAEKARDRAIAGETYQDLMKDAA